jgi:hypothetical protein
MPNVIGAQAARWQWWTTAPLSERVDTMATAILHACKRRPFFRVFDSGDFTVPANVDAWAQIAARCPDIRFWVPTRVWWRPEFAAPLARLAALPNVAVRRSALFVDSPPPVDVRLPLTSGVTSTGPGCPKQSAGSCEAAGCRACWSRDHAHVDYHVHGQKAPIKWQAILARRGE